MVPARDDQEYSNRSKTKSSPSKGEFRSSCGWVGYKNLWGEPGQVLVIVGNGSSEFGDHFALDQVDGAASEPAARHARAINSFYLSGNVHHEIQFPAAHRIILIQTLVREVH